MIAKNYKKFFTLNTQASILAMWKTLHQSDTLQSIVRNTPQVSVFALTSTEIC